MAPRRKSRQSSMRSYFTRRSSQKTEDPDESEVEPAIISTFTEPQHSPAPIFNSSLHPPTMHSPDNICIRENTPPFSKQDTIPLETQQIPSPPYTTDDDPQRFSQPLISSQSSQDEDRPLLSNTVNSFVQLNSVVCIQPRLRVSKATQTDDLDEILENRERRVTSVPESPPIITVEHVESDALNVAVKRTNMQMSTDVSVQTDVYKRKRSHSDPEWEPENLFVSKLSRSQNLARRRLRSETERKTLPMGDNKEIEKGSIASFFAVKKRKRHNIIVEQEVEEIHSDKEENDRDVSPSVNKCNADDRGKSTKSLHPFFAVTSHPTRGTGRKRPKQLKKHPTLCDPWNYTGATVHVNFCGNVHGNQLFEQPPILNTTQHPKLSVTCKPCVSFQHLFSEKEVSMDTSSPRSVVEEMKASDHALWTEKAKLDRRLDVVSGKETKELNDWLRSWYSNEGQSRSASDTGAEDSEESCELMSQETVDEKERVAIITGPTGCGKSTIVYNVASQLGLSVLEINSSMMRTGKRIREIIKEALSTHRVIQSHQFGKDAKKQDRVTSRNTGGKTLILFEEVDQIQGDERGFWRTLQELARSSDCKRPLVCTASSFTSQMREVFDVPYDAVCEDLRRLFLRHSVENNPDTMPFRHISFASRHERQMTAVLKRVRSGRHVDKSFDMTEEIAVAFGNDTRQAINQIQFWGAKGLQTSLPQKVSGKGYELNNRISSLNYSAGGSFVSTVFQIGTSRYSLEKYSNTENAQEDTISCLKSWERSLDLFCIADEMKTMITSRAGNSDDLNSDDASEEFFKELDVLSPISEDLESYSLSYSADYLSLEDDYLEVHKTMKGNEHRMMKHTMNLSERIPIARKPLVTDYAPLLTAMAVANDSVTASNNVQGVERIPRTRSKRRLSGFAALDLQPETVTVLQEMAGSFTKSGLYNGQVSI